MCKTCLFVVNTQQTYTYIMHKHLVTRKTCDVQIRSLTCTCMCTCWLAGQVRVKMLNCIPKCSCKTNTYSYAYFANKFKQMHTIYDHQPHITFRASSPRLSPQALFQPLTHSAIFSESKVGTIVRREPGDEANTFSQQSAGERSGVDLHGG